MNTKEDSIARPRMTLSRRRADWLLEIVAGLSLVALLVIVGFSWKLLPARVPLHYGFSGAPDAWGNRFFALMLPAIAVALYLLLSALAKTPHILNYPTAITATNAEQQYRLARRMLLLLKTLFMLVFIVLYVKTWRTAVGTQTGLTPWFLPSFFVSVAAIIGWYFSAARRQA